MREAVKVSNDSPVLLDRYLNDAIERDVDCLATARAGPDRRRDGAYRAGWRALGRLRLRAAAARQPEGRDRGRDQAPERRHGRPRSTWSA